MNAKEKKADRLHDQAMEIAHKAVDAKRMGNEEEALQYFSQAFDLERETAMYFVNKLEIEPCRSVFFRSAAWLAFHAEQYREAERMAAFGLSGNPPEMIEDELREVLELILPHLSKPKSIKKRKRQKVAAAA